MAELHSNTLYYGDNLEILRDHIPDESVDLVYLDPPFNSQASYNVLFKEPTGEQSAAQLRAFSDTWYWDTPTERTFQDIVEKAPLQVAKMVDALLGFVGRNDMMAYLVMMTVRLVELRRVLKPTGSLYLHCDPTASHYLKVVLDTIFGVRNFRNEIVWKRFSGHGNVYRSFGKLHDTLFFYTKGDKWKWNQVYRPLSERYIESFFHNVEPETGRRYQMQNVLNPNKNRPNLTYEWNGHVRVWKWTRQRMQQLHDAGLLVYSKTGLPRLKQYLDESQGEKLPDIWDDIRRVGQSGDQNLGYETQKPLALLERIIGASSNEGDIVLDPFCGCGTAVVAAHKLNRRWTGIDITHLAITVMKKRLQDSFGLEPGRDYQVVGEPVDLAGAQALARQDRYQFQWWAVSLVNALPQGGERRKGADQGVDGVIGFMEQGGRAKRVIVQVKSGQVNVSQIRDLKGTMEREKADLGLFIALEPSTEPMRLEALSAGFYRSELWQQDYPRIQICTIEDLLVGKLPKLPRSAQGGFQRAQRIRRGEGEQAALSEQLASYIADRGPTS